MASTYSTNLAIELIGTGDQAGTWGTTTNSNLGTLIEQSISGYVTQAVATGTDTTITIPNGSTGVARNMYIELTGTGGASTNLIVPANKKLYFIFNNSTGAVTVKVSAQTGVSVPTGKKMVLVSNGTDIVNGLNYIADFATNSFTVTNLTASSGTITNLIATSGSITNLVSSDASATVLRAGSATLTHLSATSATITNLTLTSLVISNLSIASANITTLTSASATITNLLATSLAVSSIATFAAGSAAAPSITTTGDTNTGLFFPAADTIAFTEGGVESMRINSSGNVGIGTASPAVRVHAYSGTTMAQMTVDGAGAIKTGINFASSGTTYGQIYFDNNSPYNMSVLQQYTTGSLIFGTNNTETMRLDASGNLGLGVTPSAWTYFKPLQAVRSAFAGSAGQTAVGYNWYFDGAYKYYANDYALAYQQNAVSGQHTWSTAASGSANATITFTQAMTLDASGNLLVGATAAVSGRNEFRLGGNGSGSLITMGRSGTNKLNIGVDSSDNVDIENAANTPIRIYINSTERLRLDSSGNLGIQTAGSTYTLGSAFQLGRVFSFAQDINSGYLGAGWFGTNSGTATYAVTGNYAVRQSFNSADGSINFSLAPTGTAGNTVSFTQAMSLTSAGVLLLGATSSYAAKMNIAWDSSVESGIILRTTSATLNGNPLIFQDSGGVARGSVSQTASAVTYNTSSDYRLKTVLGAVANAGQRIDALQPVEYTWNDNGERARGFLAHQFQDVYASSVSGIKDAVDTNGKPVYQAMQASTSEVIADLVAELQSLRKRVAELESK